MNCQGWLEQVGLNWCSVLVGRCLVEGRACLEGVLGRSVVEQLQGVVGVRRFKLRQRIGREGVD